jgi:hypothetical protein
MKNMSGHCKRCAAHRKAYTLCERDPRVGFKAVESTLEPFMEHLREIEEQCYREALEAFLKTSEKESRSEKAFLDAYAQQLEAAFEQSGCDVRLAKCELSSWMSRGDKDYSGVRIGLSLLGTAGGETKQAGKDEQQALSA